MISNQLRIQRLTHLMEVAKLIPAPKFNMAFWMKPNQLAEEYPGLMPDNFAPMECTTAGCVLGFAGMDKEFREQGLKTVMNTTDDRYAEKAGTVFYKGKHNGDAAQAFFGITQTDSSDLFAPSSYTFHPISRNDVIDKIADMIHSYRKGSWHI